jgi:hypothetical protein
MQWYKWDEVKNYDASGDNSAIKNYGADEYEEGMFNAGFGINSDSRVYELEKAADGSYVLTLTLPGNLYYYDYTVTYADGSHETIKDPGNMPVPNPASGSDAGHSLFYVGDKDNTTKGQEYIYERTDDLKGTYEFQPYKAIDGTTQYIGVYLPYGYDESKTYKTPTLRQQAIQEYGSHRHRGGEQGRQHVCRRGHTVRVQGDGQLRHAASPAVGDKHDEKEEQKNHRGGGGQPLSRGGDEHGGIRPVFQKGRELHGTPPWHATLSL